MDGAAEMGTAPARARLQHKIKTLGYVKTEMSTRNLGGAVKGTVGSLSLEVRSTIRVRDTILKVISREKEFKAQGWMKPTRK